MTVPRQGLVVPAVVVALVLAVVAPGLAPPSQAEAASPCPEGEVPPSGFADVAGNFHEESIACVVWHGIARGISSTEYAPARGVRRDQMAAFLVRTIAAAGVDLGAPTDQGFTDIGGNTHAGAINQLAAFDVVLGTTATTYSPAGVVRRDQMASFVVRAAELVGQEALDAEPTAFTDIAGSVHEDNIAKMVTNGLARGTTATTYSPRNDVRRDQMASFLTNTLVLLGVRPPGDEPPTPLVYQVQPMYVVPSDGPDRGLAADGTIAESVRNFNDWLADETGGSRIRVPKVGGEASVVFHRLSRTEAYMAEKGDLVLDALDEELKADGFTDPGTMYLVYYDGVVDGNRCGGSGNEFLRTAANYIKDCEEGEGVGTPNVDMGMIHEIAHGLGLVPTNVVDGTPCAPNHTADGHVSTSPQDLLYAGEEDWDTDNMRLDVSGEDYAYTPYRPGCANLLFSAFLDPLPEPNFPPPNWEAGAAVQAVR